MKIGIEIKCAWKCVWEDVTEYWRLAFNSSLRIFFKCYVLLWNHYKIWIFVVYLKSHFIDFINYFAIFYFDLCPLRNVLLFNISISRLQYLHRNRFFQECVDANSARRRTTSTMSIFTLTTKSINCYLVVSLNLHKHWRNWMSTKKWIKLIYSYHNHILSLYSTLSIVIHICKREGIRRKTNTTTTIHTKPVQSSIY